MKKSPRVSIIIVNFNGKQLLKSCLSSIAELEYPKKSIEVILVDNNSSDDSVPYVRKNFPEVHVVENKENGGFTGGNILGLSHATGEYIVLLNSDVVVDSYWMQGLVDAAADETVGIVSSRLRYAFPFIELVIDSAAVPKSKVFNTIDHSPIGALVEEIVCDPASLNSLVQYKSGFYDKKDGEICTRRTSGRSTVLLPFDPEKRSNEYMLTLHGLESKESIDIPVELSIGSAYHHKTVLRAHEAQQITLEIRREAVQSSYVWLIQNAGNIILSNGYGKDRGNVIFLREKERTEEYEVESPYFLEQTPLLAACGASCLIKRAVIDNVGFLDGYYFMYYEDVELSLRAWRAGWNIVYEPSSLGYHKHRATTGIGESAFFLGQVERNHLAFVITHFPIGTVIQEIILFLSRACITTLKSLVFQFIDNESRARAWKQKYEGRKIALKYILHAFPRLWKARLDMDQYWPINYKRLEKMLY